MICVPIRNSLFDLIRKQDQTYNEAKLVERTQRENGHSLGEKLADAIFIIFQYIEGANNVSELKQCISRSRRTTVVTDENDAVMADIFNRLSNRTNNKPTDSAILLSMLMDIKQIITDTMKPISDNVEKLANNFTNEISVLRNKLKENDLKIENLQIEIQENQMRISRLQSEAKLHSQQLKELDNELQEKEQQKQYTDKISNRLDAIDNKRQKKDNNKKSYSGAVSQTIENDQQAIPVISTSSIQHNMNSNLQNEYEQILSTTIANNYVDYSHLCNTEENPKQVEDGIERHIERRVTDNDTAVFRGVVRKRTKRIVLYNVIADKPFELVDSAVRSYAESKGVHVTFKKVLKKYENRRNPTYIMRVNVLESDFESTIENDSHFWLRGVY